MARNERTTWYRIGVADIALTTAVSSLARQHADLYQPFIRSAPPPDDSPVVHVRVRKTPINLRHRRRFIVTANDRVQFEPAGSREVLPWVEWAINWEIPRVYPQYLQLHASSLDWNGQGIILPGDSGSGKSTLTAGLFARGWRYLCDEFALIDAKSLILHPYPRAICLKMPSFAPARAMGLELTTRRHYAKGAKGCVGFLNPKLIRPDAIGNPCPIRYVIFPSYKGGEPRLTPISRAEAAFDLHRVCFNLFSCDAVGLDVIAGMIRGANCYRLESGDLQATCELVERLVEETGEANQSGSVDSRTTERRQLATAC